MVLRVGGCLCRLDWAEDGGKTWVAFEGRTYLLEPEADPAPARRRAAAGHGAQPGDAVVRAPMPAQVRALQTRPGDLVVKGQTLLVLEAMKMEIRVQAPLAGQVEHVLVTAGQQVNRDQVLLEIKPDS